LDAVLRGVDGGLTPARRSVLVRLAGREELDARVRTSALSILADHGPDQADGPQIADTLVALGSLRSDPEATVAAAAWLAWLAFGGDPADLSVPQRRALERGGSLAVQHSRLTRAIQRQRQHGAAQ
jgi:hypothetical protein